MYLWPQNVLTNQFISHEYQQKLQENKLHKEAAVAVAHAPQILPGDMDIIEL